MSFAIEFVYLPDFAGTKLVTAVWSELTVSGTPDSPGTFTDNLLNNIGDISGTKPYIRVGGNSQDLAIYDSTLENATDATFSKTPDGLRTFDTVRIGDKFFDSFKTWPGTKFIYGLNLKNSSTSAAGWQSLMDTIPMACDALGLNLLYWEYGNEPDFYPRPKSSWTDTSYVSTWANGTSALQSALSSSCPDMSNSSSFGLVGPSLAESSNLPPQGIFENGYNRNGTVKQYALHNYMGDCARQACNLQRDLMNHSAVVNNLADVAAQISPLNNGPLVNPTDSTAVLPFVLGETNSFLSLLAGPDNFANTFGAALWTVDYMLQAASIGISRMHMQQGTGFGYNSWQPVPLKKSDPATAPPYYGNVVVASVLGNIPRDQPRVVGVRLPGQDELEAAYATYANGSTLARIAVVNMHAYNATNNSAAGGSGSSNGSDRGSRSYTFSFPDGGNVKEGQSVGVQRLRAAGSDVATNVTWDGWSYDFGLKRGLPVKVGSQDKETLSVSGGAVTVQVEDSGAVVLNFT